MSPYHGRRYLTVSWMTVSWMSLVTLAFLAADDASVRNVALLAAIGLAPPAVMMALWKVPSRAARLERRS